jgi:hypothetical protein
VLLMPHLAAAAAALRAAVAMSAADYRSCCQLLVLVLALLSHLLQTAERQSQQAAV